MGSHTTDAAMRVRQQILDSLGDRSQGWLGIEVARVEDRDDPYTQPAVSGWLAKIENLHPDRMFAIEKALGRAPGSLSRHLGYVPADTAPALSVPAAIEADPSLDAIGRGYLLDVYATAVERSFS